MLIKLVDDCRNLVDTAAGRRKPRECTRGCGAVRTPSKRVMQHVKNAMLHRTMTIEHPASSSWDRSSVNGARGFATAWTQRPCSSSASAQLNQPDYLADPGIIYRSLAGGMGIVRQPPWQSIPGAAYECKGGPKCHATTELLRFLRECQWDADVFSSSKERAALQQKTQWWWRP